MFLNKKILAIIPARGGSKGLPGKNIKELAGKPLISWTIEQAKACTYIDEIFVSTDSEEIAETAAKFGIKVPGLRPENISTDKSPSSEFILYTLELLQKAGRHFDYVILLEPTSPLRKDNDIRLAIEKLINNAEADSIISLGQIHTEHPDIVKKIDEHGYLAKYIESEKNITQRQMTEAAYFPYGVIYMVKTSVFIETHSFYSGKVIPYFIERWQNYEVDDIYDFLAIEAVLKHQMK